LQHNCQLNKYEAALHIDQLYIITLWLIG
jgi:hypothetical protein